MTPMAEKRNQKASELMVHKDPGSSLPPISEAAHEQVAFRTHSG